MSATKPGNVHQLIRALRKMKEAEDLAQARRVADASVRIVRASNHKIGVTIARQLGWPPGGQTRILTDDNAERQLMGLRFDATALFDSPETEAWLRQVRPTAFNDFLITTES